VKEVSYRKLNYISGKCFVKGTSDCDWEREGETMDSIT
jgi:hypothetical protein